MNRLAPILASRRGRVRALRDAGLEASTRRKAEELATAVRPLLFEERLRRPGMQLIAEIKRRSPAAGLLAGDDFDPVAIGRAYSDGGAAAISIVVERDHFDGDPAWVPLVANATTLPILWKDFVVDELVIHEAKAGGASAVLLIVAALGDAELRRFLRTADELQLSVLVEVHTEDEARRATDAGARIIGVNSRDLTTFVVDLGVAERIGRQLPAGSVRVAESGIKSGADVKRLESAGFGAILVGETLMRSRDVPVAIRELLSSA